MVHKKDSSLARKVRAGEYLGADGALALGRAEYRADGNRVKWASTLLSALNHFLPGARAGDWEAVTRASRCVFELAPFARRWERFATAHRFGIAERYTPDQCDVIASVLLAWYRLPWASHLYARAAREYAESAHARTKSDPGAHTPARAALTLARIALLRLGHAHRGAFHYRDEALRYLRDAQTRAPHLRDPNQKSRVYRGIAKVIVGIHGHTHDALLAARGALDAADAVAGIAADVRAKNVAARERLKL